MTALKHYLESRTVIDMITDNLIRELEEIAMNAFPAIQTELYDGWILRYSNGYTFRGNSVNPIYDSNKDIEYKIDECERRYQRLDLPTVFKMTPAVNLDLDCILEKRGYVIQKKNDIMVATLDELTLKDNKSQATQYSVVIENILSEEWLEGFVVLNGTTEEIIKSTCKTVLSQILNPVICASIYDKETMIACGLGVVESNYVGLYDIRVRDTYRRKGLATQLCREIMQVGKSQGAQEAYLQVMATNSNAISLYEKLGFERYYSYWYRVKGTNRISD